MTTTKEGILIIEMPSLEHLIIREDKMKIFTVSFSPLYPVPSGMIIKADTLQDAEALANKTITHTNDITVKEITLTDEAQVLFYESGDY